MPIDTSRNTPPPMVRPGEPITANWANRLVRAMVSRLRIVGRDGITVTQRGDSMVIGLTPGYQIAQLHRVSAVRVSGSVAESTLGQSVTDRQSLITYDLVPYGVVNRAELTDVAPNHGRPHQNGNYQIQSAAVGDVAMVYTLVVGEADDRARYIHILNERIGDPVACAGGE